MHSRCVGKICCNRCAKHYETFVVVNDSIFNKYKMVKDKKAFFSRFNEYKKQKELQEYMNTNYRTLKLLLK